jgi:hypothetical protein
VAEHAIDVAQVVKISRQVEELLTPHPWLPSTEEDLLNPGDGMRTFEQASTELAFSDGTRLVISEDSLVFLDASGKVDRPVRRDEIEIVVGQADIEADAAANERHLTAGGSRLTPRPGVNGRTRARFRRPQDGGAQVMVYAGASAVESGGITRQVPAGMGTQMKEGAPPAEPEELLPAAEALSPAAGSEWSIGDPPFSWRAIESAASYVVEICLDPGCGRLIRRRTGIEETTARFAGLEAGSYHWRATAVSASGLDGYPSQPTAFTILSAARDEDPPVITMAFAGSRLERDGLLYLGPGASLGVEIIDTASGVERTWAVLDGRQVELADVESGWTTGGHSVVIHARDRAGNEGRTEVLRFVYDPVPPEIHWGDESGGLYHVFRGESAPLVDLAPGGSKDQGGPGLVWSLTRREWQPVGEAQWTVERSIAPRFFLRSARRKARIQVLSGVFGLLTRKAGVGVLAHDDLVGTRNLIFRLEGGAEGERRLVVEAIDWLGNRSSVTWPLRRGRSPGR